MNFENFFSLLNFQIILRANFPFRKRKNKSDSDLLSISMAIPIDDEYNENNDYNNNNVIINQEGRAAQVNHLNNRNRIQRRQVINNPGVNWEENIGYLQQLVNEIQAVFTNYYAMRPQQPQEAHEEVDMIPLRFNEVIGHDRISGGIDDHENNRRSSFRRCANSNGESGNRRRTDARVGNMQDNQIPTGLPDIISCHLGASLRINHSSSPSLPSRDIQNDQNDQDELRPQPPPYVASRHGDESDPPSEDDEYSSFGLKVQVNCSYRGIGRDLRQIADSYELQNDRRRRRRHPAERQSPPTSSSFKFEFSLKVAIPAVTLVGLGLAYLRRSS